MWLIPALLWGCGWLLNDWAINQTTSPDVPTTITAGSRNIDSKQGVQITVTAGRLRQLNVHDTGTVTKVLLRIGDPISSGTPVIEIDGTPRIAYTAAVPFYRNLDIGDTGEDVAALAQFLYTGGYLPEVAEETEQYFGWNLRAALKRFQQDHGLLADGVLRNEEYLFLSPAFGNVTEIHAVVGEQVPAEGSIAVGSGSGHRIDIAAAGGDESPSGFRSEDTLVLTADDERTPISGFRIETEEAASLLTVLDDWAARDLIKRTFEDDAFSYTGTFVSLAEPINVAMVPHTAVFAGEQGLNCVVQVSAAGKHTAVRVSPLAISGELGVVGVDSGLIGTVMVRNTLELNELPPCR